MKTDTRQDRILKLMDIIDKVKHVAKKSGFSDGFIMLEYHSANFRRTTPAIIEPLSDELTLTQEMGDALIFAKNIDRDAFCRDKEQRRVWYEDEFGAYTSIEDVEKADIGLQKYGYIYIAIKPMRKLGDIVYSSSNVASIKPSDSIMLIFSTVDNDENHFKKLVKAIDEQMKNI